MILRNQFGIIKPNLSRRNPSFGISFLVHRYAIRVGSVQAVHEANARITSFSIETEKKMQEFLCLLYLN